MVNYTTLIISLLIESILNAILSYYLQIEFFADVTLSLRLIFIFGSVYLLGTQDANLKSLRLAIVKNDTKEIQQYIAWNFSFVKKTLLTSIILALVFFIIFDPLNLFFWGTDTLRIYYLPFIFFVAPLFSVVRLFSSFISCQGKSYISLLINDLGLNLLLLILIFLEFSIFNTNPNNEIMVLRIIFKAYAALAIIVIGFTLVYFWKHLSALTLSYNPKLTKLKWVEDAKTHARNILAFTISSNITILLVGALAFHDKKLAYYNISFLIAKFVVLIPTAIFRPFIPSISSVMHNKKNRLALSKNWSEAKILNMVLVSLTCLLIFIFDDEILGIFGSEFRESQAVYILDIILIGESIRCLFGYNELLLCYTNLINELTKIELINLILQLSLSLVFFNINDITGIALAYAISINIYSILVYSKTKQCIPLNNN